jgi:hypothetical protein
MRRALVGVAALLTLSLVVGLWLRPTSGELAVEQPEPGRGVPPKFTPVDVRATDAQGLNLSGVVRGSDGEPIGGATVFLASTEQQSLTTVRCQHCAALMLSCRARETAVTVGGLLDTHQGEQRAAASTTSDAQGRFRFERLAGISFTVWGKADGHGLGVKERAAPGDPVELFLPSPRSLSGRLRDDSGQVVRGTVRAVSRRLAEVVSVDSDSEGRFTFNALGEGPFYLHASGAGLLPAFRSEVQAGTDLVSLTLVRPRALEVRLVTNDQKPIAGTVKLVGDHLEKEIVAKDGLTTITGLSPGSLMASAVAGELAAAPHAVTLSSPTTRITLVLEKGGWLSVTVLDEQEQPVPDPTVELLTSNLEPITKRRLQTGELAVLGPVATGDYTIRAGAEGFTTVTVPAKVSSSESPVEITLVKGTVIAGRVIDEYGRAAPGVSVLISPLGESVVSGGDGRFRATVPSKGLYSLQAHHSDWGGGEVKVAAPKEGVELQLEPRAGCEITVQHNGRRIEGASVMLFTSEGNFRSDRVSGADGVVLMRGMPPNVYTLVSTHPEFLPSERQSAKLEDGQLLRLTAELKQGANVTGQVVDPLGAPVSGISVTVVPRGTEPVTSDTTGNFSLGPLRPNGTYSVRVSQRGYDQSRPIVARAGGEPIKVVVTRQPTYRGRVLGAGQPLKHFRVEAHDVSSTDGTFDLPLPSSEDRVVLTIESPGFEPLVTDRPNTPDLGEFDLKRTPQVTGVVRDESGGGVTDAVVSCDSCEQSVMTGNDGRFTLSKPPYQHEFNLVAKKGRRTATRLVAGDALAGLELILKPGVVLSGTAFIAGGRPASGVEIVGLNLDRSEPVSVVTNADGTYSMEVAPGFYRFSMTGPGVPTVSADPPTVILQVSEPQMRFDFGPAPDLGTVVVRVKPDVGMALWLVRGVLGRVGNPPMELMRSAYAQMVFQPHSDRVVFAAVPPGQYSLVWSSFHAPSESGPVVVPIEVPSPAEFNLVR